ncbi:unnamed protein product [Boreogadus saida]
MMGMALKWPRCDPAWDVLSSCSSLFGGGAVTLRSAQVATQTDSPGGGRSQRTALHWAAKQGRLDTVDLMFLSGVDVNVRSGYTALHLASIHSHQHMVLALINTYNAKTNIRDYHGKKPAYYWSGRSDAFNIPGAQSGKNHWSGRSDAFNIPGAQSVASPDCKREEMFGKLGYGRRSQRYPLPAMLLSRSRSQGQLSTDLTAAPQSPRLQILDIPMAF